MRACGGDSESYASLFTTPQDASQSLDPSRCLEEVGTFLFGVRGFLCRLRVQSHHITSPKPFAPCGSEHQSLAESVRSVFKGTRCAYHSSHAHGDDLAGFDYTIMVTSNEPLCRL